MNRFVLCLLLLIGGLVFGSGSALACCVFGSAPSIDSIAADPGLLWPPNHKMVEVFLNVEGEGFDPDGDGTPDDWCVTDVQILNTGAGEGNPNNDPDFLIEGGPCGLEGQEFDGGQELWLRAERSGEAGARTYVVYVTAWNEIGIAVESTLVMVPHDMGE